MSNVEERQEPKKLLERSLVWFVLGIIVAAVVGTLGAVAWLQGFVDKRIEDKTAAPPGFPNGVVLAFDRAEGCPDSWQIFEPAISRTIIGAVAGRSSEAPTKDENGQRLSARQYRDDGGAEVHTLTIKELPAHGHDFKGKGATKGGWGGQATRAIAVGGSQAAGGDYVPSGSISQTGSGQPHNNMQPFIALFLCKQDSH